MPDYRITVRRRQCIVRGKPVFDAVRQALVTDASDDYISGPTIAGQLARGHTVVVVIERCD